MEPKELSLGTLGARDRDGLIAYAKKRASTLGEGGIQRMFMFGSGLLNGNTVVSTYYVDTDAVSEWLVDYDDVELEEFAYSTNLEVDDLVQLVVELVVSELLDKYISLYEQPQTPLRATDDMLNDGTYNVHFGPLKVHANIKWWWKLGGNANETI